MKGGVKGHVPACRYVAPIGGGVHVPEKYVSPAPIFPSCLVFLKLENDKELLARNLRVHWSRQPERHF